MARKWEPADTVIALSVGLVGVIFAIFGFLVWQGQQQTLVQAEARAARAAEILAIEAEWVVKPSLVLLRTLLRDTGQGPIGSIDAADIAGLPADATLRTYDADGRTLDSDERAGPADISDTPYFQELAAGADFAVAAEAAAADGQAPGFVIAHRIGEASFAGVLLIRTAPTLLHRFWVTQDLGEGSTVSLVRMDGWIVARHPPASVTTNIGNAPAFQMLESASTGSYLSAVSPIDGVSRVVAFRRIPSLDLIAFASVSRDAAMAGLWTAVRTVLYLMVPIGVALLGGSFLTAHLLRQSERNRVRLEAAVAHNEVLFREIHHRVKNNLQSVGALLQLQPIPREIKEEMGQRIAAMSAVHEHIYRTNSFGTVWVGDYLRTLIANIRAGQSPDVVLIDEIEDVPVDKDVASPLGLIVNEVVSNAFKHAFRDGRAGVVRISLDRVEPLLGRLVVEDNGVGFDPEIPTKGIGRRLITALTAQIGGKSELTTGEGSRFFMTFPIMGDADRPAERRTVSAV